MAGTLMAGARFAMPPAGPAAAAPAEQSRSGPIEPEGVTSLGIKLVDAPVSRRDDPRAHVYIVDHVSPGDVIERRVAVTNHSQRPREVALYPGAASVAECGFSFAAGRTGNELTSWVRLEQASLELAAGEQELVWATRRRRRIRARRSATRRTRLPDTPGTSPRMIFRACGLRLEQDRHQPTPAT